MRSGCSQSFCIALYCIALYCVHVIKAKGCEVTIHAVLCYMFCQVRVISYVINVHELLTQSSPGHGIHEGQLVRGVHLAGARHGLAQTLLVASLLSSATAEGE